MRQVLSSWKNTPYMEGQQCKGAGVDCVRLIFAVLDELYRCTRSPEQRFPQHLSMNSSRGPTLAARFLLRQYPVRILRGACVEPGDILGIRNGKGVGHAMIVGPDPHTAWHATKPRVSKTGIMQGNIMRIWRPEQKETWA